MPDTITYELEIYKANKEKVEEKKTEFKASAPFDQIIKIQTQKLDWINNNSVVMTLGNVKCTAIHLASN